MAAANPNSCDFYRRGQPFIGLKSKVSNNTADYYRRLQPLIPMVMPTSTVVKDILRAGVIIPFKR